MNVIVRTLTGKAFNVKLAHPRKLVEDLRDRIHEAEGVPPDQQRLSFEGRFLEDGRTLAACGMSNDSSVTLYLRLRGC
ncbi:hypothetical protein WJX73_007794 [Symbiochloris irregularis]|uniref:Ubiquitin-like domain-containing protein n=1 Tax=Symbiochloris irregularis TaxID=706552 RepID=A0AAW1NR11_9CHLO